MTESTSTAYYLPLAVPDGADADYEYFQPTQATTSVWSPALQHGGPPTGLLVRAMEQATGGSSAPDGQAFSRVTMEILGAISHEVNRVRTWVPRPGRQISQIAAELEERQPDGTFRTVGRATAWRLTTRDSSQVQSLPRPPLTPGVDEAEHHIGFPQIGDEPIPWGQIGFIGTVETAVATSRNGATPAYWLRPLLPLVKGEVTSDLASAFTVIDIANGIGSALNPTQWSWMNVDTTVHLVRVPQGPWIGVDSDLAAGADGYAATVGELYDTRGYLGRTAQAVLLSPTS
ncbi:hypothetical protein GOHSU_02_02420 [Gordonia hirsuta DSM 44140 = NBRC 16056]|uniref:Thioesterase n=1 Tax=Gordonia hirsuta DSM 44140 = NBRC 16056 TaxID=1121927 RepID=L7L7U5_9ACTN|nr:thioesterase family protein [Gordonia hirsuta]GAC56093.1 hypothetical protein GOHSU_02_02420 [Gordonia hirsuta DSM 44140 = NBRC 16056]